MIRSPIKYHLKFFQIICLNVFQGDVNHINDVSGRLFSDRNQSEINEEKIKNKFKLWWI